MNIEIPKKFDVLSDLNQFLDSSLTIGKTKISDYYEDANEVLNATITAMNNYKVALEASVSSIKERSARWEEMQKRLKSCSGRGL